MVAQQLGRSLRHPVRRRAVAVSAAAFAALAITVASPGGAPTASADSVVTTIPVGTYPEQVAITPDGTRAYVANWGSDTVSVIDTATNTVTATIPVGNSGVVVITPDGTRAYVTDSASNTVSVIATATNTVTATIPVNHPNRLAITPDGTRAYVTTVRSADHAGINDGSDWVSVIDTATNTVTGTILVGDEARSSDQPLDLAITPDGTHVYVTGYYDSTDYSGIMSVIDTATNTVTSRFPGGLNTHDVAITPDGTRAYVTDMAHSVSVIDTAQSKVIATIHVGSHEGCCPLGDRENPEHVVITPDGRRAYVTIAATMAPTTQGDPYHDWVYVIDTATNRVIDSIQVDPDVTGIAFTPDGTRAYMVAAGKVTVIAISETAPTTPAFGS